jgi:glycosyltransferase involved in cell wall biosynthesis
MSNYLARYPRIRKTFLKIYAKVFFGSINSQNNNNYKKVQIPEFARHTNAFISNDLVVVDCQSMQSSSFHRGIGRYSRCLIQALAGKYLKNNFLLVFNSSVTQDVIELVSAELIQNSNNIRIYISTAFPTIDDQNYLDTSSALTDEIVQLNPKLLLLLSVFERKLHVIRFELNRFQSSAVILYDLIPVEFPEWFLKDKFVSDYYFESLNYVLQASEILAISQTSLNVLQKYCETIPPFRVIHGSGYGLGVGSFGKSLDLRAGIVLVGSDSPHKNIGTAIEAFSRLSRTLQQRHPLHILGVSRGEQRRLMKNFSDLTPNVIFHGIISHQQLNELYASSRITIVPSFQEGLGMPVLEAWNEGCVVVGSALTAVAEVLSSHSVTFDPYSADDMSKSIMKFLTDDVAWQFEQNRLLDERLKFSWEKTADRFTSLMNSYE